MKKTEKKIVQSRAAYKAHRTRKVNALLREYDEAPTAGKKAAIKRKINQIKNEPLPV